MVDFMDLIKSFCRRSPKSLRLFALEPFGQEKRPGDYPGRAFLNRQLVSQQDAVTAQP
jgi:hypothetical protein